MDHYIHYKKYHTSDNKRGRRNRTTTRESRSNLRTTIRSQLTHFISKLNTDSTTEHHNQIKLSDYKIPTHSVYQRYEHNISKIKVSPHNFSI
jgi:hypothetical protein